LIVAYVLVGKRGLVPSLDFNKLTSMKKAGIILLIVLGVTIFLGAIAIIYFNHHWFKNRPNHTEAVFEDADFQFEWAPIKGEGYLEPHGAMLVRFKMYKKSPNLYFQFDTGSPYSYIFGKSVESLQEKYDDLSISKIGKDSFLDEISGVLGGSQIVLRNLTVIENVGREIDLSDTTQSVRIGTIGTDLMEDKVTLINFMERLISIHDKRPSQLVGYDGLQPFDFKGRRLMLPSKIDGKQQTLLYDSGTSAFGLVTSKHRYKKWSRSQELEYSDQFNMNGKKVFIHHKKSDSKIQIGSADLDLQRVSYVDIYSNLQRLMSPFTKIGGWLGNKPFLESILIIDTKTEEFLVLKNVNQL